MQKINDNGEVIAEIAEDTEEKFYIDLKEKCEKSIKSSERNIKIDKCVIKLCDEELKKFSSA